MSSVSTRPQTAARENKTVLHNLQNTGKARLTFFYVKYPTEQTFKLAKLSVYLFLKVHTHPSRQGHSPKALAVPAASDTPVSRHVMQLFAALCIQTSHYVSFVKYGPDPRSWLFFDSMADRCGKIISAFTGCLQGLKK